MHKNRIQELIEYRINQLMRNKPLYQDDIDIISPSNLAECQKNALTTLLTNPVGIVNGRAGRGKSTLIRSLIQNIKRKTDNLHICSPTGKAANRLQEVVGLAESAETIHRLLKYRRQSGEWGFTYNKRNIAEHLKHVVVDEAAMVDGRLFLSLLDALPDDARLYLAGDLNQIKPVEYDVYGRPMEFLSSIVPTSTLIKNHRQGADSLITSNCDLILDSNYPNLTSNSGDFFIIESKNIPKEIVELQSRRIPNHLKCGYLDIKTITPQEGGACGHANINKLMQETINKDGWQVGEGIEFRVGDPVMQCKNNYTKNVFNGESGIVNNEKKEFRGHYSFGVNIEGGRELFYTQKQAGGELMLNYAMSIHKAQGSEYPVVIIPVSSEHIDRWDKAMLYTAISRAQKMCVVVCESKSILMDVINKS